MTNRAKHVTAHSSFVIRYSSFVTAFFVCAIASGQSLDQRLDAERYLQGLRDLRLPEVMEHFLQTHPPVGDVETTLQAIARMQAALVDAASKPPAERFKAVEALLQARADLIVRQPNDPRRATWLADQASDVFFELMPIDAAHLTALFGLPDTAQRERASKAASQMNDLAVQAEQAVDGAIRAIETAPNYARDVTMQQRRRHLAEVERDRRIAFLRGIGALLNAEINVREHAQRIPAYELTTRTLAPLTDTLDGALAIQARLYDGLAKARLGQYDEAEKRFTSVARDPAATPADIFSARMGGVINRAVHSGPQAGLEGLASIEAKYVDPASLFFRVVIADQRFLLRRALANAAPANNHARMMADAFAAYTDLLKAQYPPGSVPRDTLRAIIFARLSMAASSESGAAVHAAQLPPLVAIAQADGLSRNPSAREKAIVSLEALLKTPSLSADDRAAALFTLGRALFEHDQPLLAAQRFSQLAREYPADPQAERAIELAATLTWDEQRAAPDDPLVRQTLRETLDVLLAKYTNLKSIDRWHYAAGRLALIENRFDDASTHFAQVTSEADEWLDANFMLAATARQEATVAKNDDAARPLHRQTIETVTRVQPVIERGVAAAQDDANRRVSLQYYLAMLRVYGAEARLGLNEAQNAIDALAGIESQTNIDSEVIGEAMKVRINAYQALKKPEDALRDLQRFAQASPQQVGVVLQPMIASLTTDVERLVSAGRDEEARALATNTLLPAAKTLQAWLASADAPAGNPIALNRYVADAYRLAGQCEAALPIYESLLRDQAAATELLLGRAECLYSLGGDQRLADAMSIYKRLAAAGEGAGEAAHETYWLSQLRMLEILDRSGRNTQQILPRIEQLRQSDANFGGERFRGGFEALRAKHAGK